MLITKRLVSKTDIECVITFSHSRPTTFNLTVLDKKKSIKNTSVHDSMIDTLWFIGTSFKGIWGSGKS